jgi:hypothetical protein
MCADRNWARIIFLTAGIASGAVYGFCVAQVSEDLKNAKAHSDARPEGKPSNVVNETAACRTVLEIIKGVAYGTFGALGAALAWNQASFPAVRA